MLAASTMSDGNFTQWRDIPGYPGYQASDDGRLRSVDRVIVDSLCRTRHLRGRELSSYRDHDGYERVYVNGARLVHRLICMAFHGSPASNDLQAAHRNGDNQNNMPSNLYWATPSQNIRDVVAHGRNRNAAKTHCPARHEYTAENTFNHPSHRRCRACHRERNRVYRLRKAVA